MAISIIVSPFAARADTLPGGTHFINESVKFEPINDQLKLSISNYLDDLNEIEIGKLVRQRPAFSILINEVPFIKQLQSNSEKCAIALQMHRFCMEYFTGCTVPMASFLHDGHKVQHHEIDRDGLVMSVGEGIPIDPRAWEKQLAYAKFLYGNAHRAPATEPVITRLCRAFREGSTPDGIIDLAIAMESLVQSKLEIKFQFSLFNTLISDSGFDVRTARLPLLRHLYDARSITVHGGKPGRSDKPKIAAVSANWSALIALARDNFTYYLNFCSHHEQSAWPEHLWSLALGGERFGPEGGNQ